MTAPVEERTDDQAGCLARKPWRQGRAATILMAVLVILITSGAMFAIQFSTNSLIAYDGYFHSKFSYLMGHGYGFIRSLPWLQFTIHRDHYRDHHLLFHVLYIPFVYHDLRLGAKIGATVFAAAALAAFYLVAARRGRVIGAIATLLLLGADKMFLTRMNMVRVPALSMMFMVLGIHAVITRRNRLLAVLMALYVWLYDGFALMIPFMVFLVLAGWIIEKRFEWKTLAWGFGGIVFAIVVNPYFPENIRSYWFNLWRAAGSAQAQVERTGAEWLPLGSWELLTQAHVTWIALGVALLAAMLRGRPTRESLGLFLIVALATALVMKARRYLDTWPPMVMLYLVYAWADYWEWRRKEGAAPKWQWIATGVLALSLALTPSVFIKRVKDTSQERPYAYFKGAAEYIRDQAVNHPGTVVFNTDWDDFPFLFHFNSDCYYVVGLDQLYMIRYDKELYELWKSICEGPTMQIGKLVSERFGASYVVVDRLERPLFLPRADLDRDLKRVYEDRYCVVYRVLGP